MLDLEARAKALCAGPAGCGFLLTIEESALPVEVAARPEITIEAAAKTLFEMPPWMHNHDLTIATVLAEGPRLYGFAVSLLSVPEAAWLFAPLDRSAQLWISEDGNPPDPAKLLSRSAGPAVWERYSQQPRNYSRGSKHMAFVTSTAVDGSSSLLAGRAYEAIEWPLPQPVQQFRLVVSPAARVFEVDGPEAWHRLCVAYPATPYERPPMPEGHVGWSPYPGAGPPLGLDDRLVPDWSAVAHDWDAVHLPLGGLLTSDQGRVDSSAGWTELWGWGAEQTVWLRWCFTAAERMPALAALPEPVLDHRPRWVR